MKQIPPSGTITRTIIDYTQHGSGRECVLVLHDWNGDHTTYDPMLPYLDGFTFTYIFADLRGYGKSRYIAGEYTVAEISKDCLGLADALGWGRFHVIGHSMTGMATQRIAADAPARRKATITSVVSSSSFPAASRTSGPT